MTCPAWQRVDHVFIWLRTHISGPLRRWIQWLGPHAHLLRRDPIGWLIVFKVGHSRANDSQVVSRSAGRACCIVLSKPPAGLKDPWQDLLVESLNLISTVLIVTSYWSFNTTVVIKLANHRSDVRCSGLATAKSGLPPQPGTKLMALACGIIPLRLSTRSQWDQHKPLTWTWTTIQKTSQTCCYGPSVTNTKHSGERGLRFKTVSQNTQSPQDPIEPDLGVPKQRAHLHHSLLSKYLHLALPLWFRYPSR